MNDPDELLRDVEALRKRASRERKHRRAHRGGDGALRRLKPILIASGAALIAAVAGAIKTGILHRGETREPAALCQDSTYSYSDHKSGTCSGHRGVKKWIDPPGQ
jgi:hypothetical protein